MYIRIHIYVYVYTYMYMHIYTSRTSAKVIEWRKRPRVSR